LELNPIRQVRARASACDGFSDRQKWVEIAHSDVNGASMHPLPSQGAEVVALHHWDLDVRLQIPCLAIVGGPAAGPAAVEPQFAV